MRKIAIALLGVILSLTSCMSPDDIQIISFDDAEIVSSSQVNLTFTVENKSGRDVKVSDIKLYLSKDGEELVKGFTEDEVVIKRRSRGEVVLPLRVRVTNFGAIISLAFSGDVDSLKEGLTTRGVATVSIGGRSRTFVLDSLEELPIMDVIEDLISD